MNDKELLIKKWTDYKIITNKKILEAFKKIPREEFISKEQINDAYGDYPLPIGYGQTISQPTTVMIMTQALNPEKGDKVLEIGAGSGYQAAIISKIIGKKGKIITTEINPNITEFAKQNINKLKLNNVQVINYDGSKGYEKQAPYDKIIVTAACPKIPEPLIEQLKENGTIVIPVGERYNQQMIKGTKINNNLKTESLGNFIFVPLRGEYGY